MNIKLVDRFKRKKLKNTDTSIGYKQLYGTLYSRNDLPSSFWLDGDIFWTSTTKGSHCTTGPSTSGINGEITYRINDVEMTKMEWLLAIE